MAQANQSQPTLMGELRAVKTLIQELTEGLRNQREVLKTRGMNLPPMVMQAVSVLNKDINQLEETIVNEQTELGQLRSMRDTSSMINSSLDVDLVLNRAMDVIIALTDAERGYIILADPDTGELVFRVARENELLPKQGTSTTPDISRSILMDVLESGEPLLADNAYKDDKFSNRQSIAGIQLRSVLCVPLKYKDQITGVVYVDNRIRAGVFQESSKNLLATFANQAAVAIENARLYESVQHSLKEMGEIKELLDNVLASIGSGVITTDDDHNIITFNRAASSILRTASVDVQGKQLRGVIPGVTVDLDDYLDKVRTENAVQLMEAEMEVGEGKESSHRVALSIKLSPLKDSQQQIQGVAMVMDDVTDQKAREEAINVANRYLPPSLVENIQQIAQLALGGERREVTCMFVDVRSVVSFPPDAQPKEIMEQLNIYFGRATNCIHKANGVIDKYMGNEIMALFNTQLNPMENHAEAAVLTALEIRDAFLELYKQTGIDPDPHYYRIGMHSGVATLGNVGSLNRREFSAIGNTINMSKRFEENAEYGQIIVSPATREYLLKATDLPALGIRLEERDPIKLKGIENEIQIYEVFRS